MASDHEKYGRAGGMLLAEAARARQKFAPFNSKHEGIAIIEEEFLELRHDVFWGDKDTSLREEAVQLGAMCIRFLADLDLLDVPDGD